MIELFDSNCRLGKGPAPREGAVGDEGLKELMTRFNVTGALVRHAVAEYSDPMTGNALLTDAAAHEPRFVPQWSVLPDIPGLYPPAEETIKKMLLLGGRSVRLLPVRYGHSLRSYAVGSLMDVLARYKLSAFISLDQLASFDALYDLCADYPGVDFVLCFPGYRCLRALLPIMYSMPNLYVETSNLVTHEVFGSLHSSVGLERILFGSGYPDQSLAAAASQLLLSDIPDSDKTAVGSGNIKRLLSEVIV